MSATQPLDNDPKVKLWVSPTQIDLVELCERKYFFDRVLKMRPPTTGSQQMGIDVENHIEAALVHGTEPPKDAAGAIARAMLELLPARGTPGLVFQSEFRRKLEIVPGNEAMGLVGVLGKKDLRLPGKKVWDFKTTKDPKKYMKSAADLIKDVQCQIYAWDEILFTGGALQTMPMEWVYGKTKGAARAFNSPVAFPYPKAVEGARRAQRAALRILDMKQPGVKAEDTKFNTGACDAFGGCSHRAYCPARAKNLAQLFGFEETKQEEKKMGIKDKLKASLGIAGTAPAQPDPTPVAPAVVQAAAVAQPAQPAPAAQPTGALGANGKPIVVFGDAACSACGGTQWNLKGGPCKPCNATGYEDGVEPTPAPVEVAPPAPASAPPATGVNPPDASLSPDDQPKTEAPAVEEKPKRGRRTKAQIEADEAASQREAAQADPVFPKVEQPATSGGLTLYVDCVPVKGSEVFSMDTFVQLAVKRAAEKAGVQDYRLVEYGKGPAFVLMAFAEIFASVNPKGSFTINSRLPESAAVLGWLQDQATSVVKGVA